MTRSGLVAVTLMVSMAGWAAGSWAWLLFSVLVLRQPADSDLLLGAVMTGIAGLVLGTPLCGTPEGPR